MFATYFLTVSLKLKLIFSRNHITTKWNDSQNASNYRKMMLLLLLLVYCIKKKKTKKERKRKKKKKKKTCLSQSKDWIKIQIVGLPLIMFFKIYILYQMYTSPLSSEFNSYITGICRNCKLETVKSLTRVQWQNNSLNQTSKPLGISATLSI